MILESNLTSNYGYIFFAEERISSIINVTLPIKKITVLLIIIHASDPKASTPWQYGTILYVSLKGLAVYLNNSYYSIVVITTMQRSSSTLPNGTDLNIVNKRNVNVFYRNKVYDWNTNLMNKIISNFKMVFYTWNKLITSSIVTYAIYNIQGISPIDHLVMACGKGPQNVLFNDKFRTQNRICINFFYINDSTCLN